MTDASVPPFASLVFLVPPGASAQAVFPLAQEARRQERIGEVIAVGELSAAERTALLEAGVRSLSVQGGAGTLLKAGAAECRGTWIILQDAVPGYRAEDYPALLQPLINGEADAVYGVRCHGENVRRAVPPRGITEAAIDVCTAVVTDLDLTDIGTGMRAFRSELLRGMPLCDGGEGIDVELAVKLAAQLFRIHEVPVHVDAALPPPSLTSQLRRAATLARYALLSNDGDNMHEGYNTLLRMEEGAPRYNAWLGRKLSRHLGRRVLEVGAGIGTITKEIARGRELVVALEVDRFYYDRLVNLFAGMPQVRPVLSGVEQADWDRLADENLDSIVLSNVLEHIADDKAALANFRRVLKAGGRVVCLAPAIPALFGSMDRAVGHYRRYTAEALSGLFEDCGFRVKVMEPMNVLGIPGWFINGRILGRRGVPPLQLRAYDLFSPLVAMAEERFHPSIGMSLLAVGEAV